MKKLLIGIGSLSIAVGAHAQGFMNGATFAGAANAPALLVNYYQGASFSYTYSGSNYVYQNMIGFAPGPANPALGANADKAADFNLGATPGTAKFQVALYVGAKGETDPSKFFRALPAGAVKTNAAFASAKAGYVLSSSSIGKVVTEGLIGGQLVTFQSGDEISAQVRAWVSSPGTPEYESYEAFMQNVHFGQSGQAGYAGVSGVVQTKSGSSSVPGNLAPVGGTPLTGIWFLYPVPEPSVVGLGLLGLAGLFFIRRRK